MEDNSLTQSGRVIGLGAAALLLYTATSLAQIPGSTAAQVQPGYMVAPGVSGCPSSGPACWLATNLTNPLPVVIAPSGNIGVTFTSSPTLTGSIVAKAASGDLYGFDVAADTTLSSAAWWIMVFNTSTLPSNGAVTPAKCYALPSGSTSFNAAFPTPITFGAGITVAASTNGCFTLSTSAHAFISADFD